VADSPDLSADLDLLSQLGVDTQPKQKAKLSAREERIIAGFEEIQRFVEEHGHRPQSGEDKAIFERLYAVRLEQIRQQQDCHELLAELDYQGLLSAAGTVTVDLDALDDDALLAELGVAEPEQDDITVLKHVKPRAATRVVEEVADRTPCEDFADFQPLFEKVERELREGERKTLLFARDASIEQGNYFILSGQMTYVAEVGDIIKAPNGKDDARLRVIYANGTESNLLLRSLQRALYKDETGRRITDTGFGPLFDDEHEDNELSDGVIYVLRSLSDHPKIAANREVVHKIGVTGGDIKKRIASARFDPTFLMAEVELVASYQLSHINRVKLENLIHRFFAGVKLDIEVKDRFGHPVAPKEWFLVPLFIIDEVVDKIRDSSIADYVYDAEAAQVMPRVQ
jgi:hypothetical protein